MKKLICMGVICTVLFSTAAGAASLVKDERGYTIGITGLAKLSHQPACEELNEELELTAVQYSKSGTTIELIQFLQNGNFVPLVTGFGNAGLSERNMSTIIVMLRKGETYQVHYQLCGEWIARGTLLGFTRKN
ncbi:hypothetical protein TUM12370_29700 [Salmonella enterica subsp. enterica serovar Choleraesuis]|nr:hypothetical protein TUM12370_29700 [Salmonella enterica subsp. enterica serovar Choleraesuis]